MSVRNYPFQLHSFYFFFPSAFTFFELSFAIYHRRYVNRPLDCKAVLNVRNFTKLGCQKYNSKLCTGPNKGTFFLLTVYKGLCLLLFYTTLHHANITFHLFSTEPKNLLSIFEAPKVFFIKPVFYKDLLKRNASEQLSDTKTVFICSLPQDCTGLTDL